MSEIDRVLEANQKRAPKQEPLGSPSPRRHLAVLTCMDARIDVFAVLGLERGDAHILRNAGARMTEDVLRSLAVSSHLLGTDTVVVMEHTDCGATQRNNEEFQALTGLSIDFHVIEDHKEALRHDIEVIATAPALSRIKEAAGLLFDVETCVATEVVRWVRGD